MGNTITLSPETVNAYKVLMMNPKDHNLDMPALADCIEECKEVTDKHILYKQYIDVIDKPLPKVFFYIIMDELYGHRVRKAPSGSLGYALKVKGEPTP